MWYIPTEGIVTAYYLLHTQVEHLIIILVIERIEHDCHLCWPSWPRCRECPFIRYEGGILCTETVYTDPTIPRVD